MKERKKDIMFKRMRGQLDMNKEMFLRHEDITKNKFDEINREVISPREKSEKWASSSSNSDEIMTGE